MLFLMATYPLSHCYQWATLSAMQTFYGGFRDWLAGRFWPRLCKNVNEILPLVSMQ